MAAFESILVIVMIIATGYFIKKHNIVSEQFRTDLSHFVVKIALPFYLINSMRQERSLEALRSSLTIMVVGFLFYVIACLLSNVVIKSFNVPEEKKAPIQFSLIFPNASYMAFPVIEILLGQQAIFYAAMFNLSFHGFLWGYGVRIFHKNESIQLKKILSPPFIAVVLGYLFFLTGVEIPTAISSFMGMVGRTASPLAMIIVGMLLGSMNVNELLNEPKLYLASIYKLVILPSLLFSVLYIIGFRGYTLFVPVIITAMPVAINSVLIATFYNKDYKTMTTLVILSTLLSLITISILSFLLGHLIPLLL